MIGGRLAVSAALAVAVMGTPARAAVTVAGANVFARAAAAIITGGNSFSTKQDQNSAVLANGRNTIDAAVSVVNEDANGNRAFDHEDAFANFLTTTSGTVNFTGNTTSLALAGNKIAEAYSSGSSFNFDFVLTSSYDLGISYFLSETDDFYTANYFQVINTKGGPPIYSLNPVNGSYDNPTTGSATIRLGPGSYAFGITERLGDLTAVQGPAYAAGSHAEQYVFSLAAAVPELSTWAMMVVGLGMIGVLVRRSSRKPNGEIVARAASAVA